MLNWKTLSEEDFNRAVEMLIVRTVEADHPGLYVTAGTKVMLPDGSVAKARELSGQGNLLFLRNSVTGAVEARNRVGTGVELNDALHTN